MESQLNVRFRAFVAILLFWVQAAQATQVLTEELPRVAVSPGTSPFRLPTSIRPLHYLLRLQPFINGNFSIHGYTEITLSVLEATPLITLHIKDILTKNETLKIYNLQHGSNTSLEVLNQTYDKELEFYTVTLMEPLEKGTEYVMQLEFIGYLNDKLKGFYRSSYTDAGGNKTWLAITQFQPTSARLAFPCFDEPAMKAEFSIELVRQDGMTAISNMPKLETIPLSRQPGWFIDKFEKFVNSSTYLVAFMISDFKYVESSTPGNETSMRVWSREDSINKTDYSLKKGLETLIFFEEFFNISFPLPKTDMVALPDFGAGAMENWGLITYRESFLLYDTEESSIGNKRTIASIISHEMAHQWFGNLVTTYWWTDLWLNEGFATYMAEVGVDAIEPTFKSTELIVPRTLRGALLSDAYENSHPISIPVGHPNEISEIFDAISYAKGASIIRMMNHYLTEETFKKGLTKFLNKYAYDVAEQDQLWEVLTAQAMLDSTLPPNVTVKDIMDTWTLQKGFPVVNVTRNQNGTATLTQEKFVILNSKPSSDAHDYKWWIPITFTTQQTPNFSVTYPDHWMKATEATKLVPGMPSNDQWVVFNIQQTGYYRVNYEPKYWNLFIQQFKKDHSAIGPLNRAQIIGDAFQLANAGILSFDIPFDIVSYLSKESEYVPLLNGIYELDPLDRKLKYTDHYDKWKSFYLSLITPHYELIGFDDTPQDTYIDQAKRGIIRRIVCYYEYKPCVDKAAQLFREWMQMPESESPISPNLRGVIYESAIKNGGNQEWDFAWKQYLRTDVIQEKIKLLRALSVTRNSTKKMMLLDLAFKPDGPIRKIHASTAFRAIIKDKESSLLAWNYLNIHWNRIREYLGSQTRAFSLLNIPIDHIQTLEDLSKRDEFIKSKRLLKKKGIRSLFKTRETILSRIKWNLKNLNSVIEWLTKVQKTNVPAPNSTF